MEQLDSFNEKGKLFDVVFVGGGPSTLSFFSYLMKNNLMDRVMKSLNILVIDKSDSFGSGCLGKYGINSNTSAEGFVRLITFSKEEDKKIESKYALSPNKKKELAKDPLNPVQTNNPGNKTDSENKHKTSIKDKIIPDFRDLFDSLPCQLLLKYSSKTAPLPLIGLFLNCLGNSLAESIHRNYNKQLLMLNSEVTSIIFDSKNKNTNLYNYQLTVKRGYSTYQIKSKVLILASGGKQKFDQTAKSEILSYISNSNDFYHSDYILQENGFSALINNLKLKKTRKIVIIGGSHSGFSCAWIILNQPADYTDPSQKCDFAPYKTKYNSNCFNCVSNHCCFGNTKLKNWGSSQKELNRTFYKKLSEVEISILYKDHIKVYYPSEKEALNDGYNLYDPKKCVNKNGNVYPFIGIRGDAKELYRKISKGVEKNVKLIKISSISDQKVLLQSADAVIWACGYTSERIKISDSNMKDLSLFEDHNLQYEVDKELNLMYKDKSPIPTLFGIGQGYSTHSIEVLNSGKTARADSVNLYNSYIAKKLFKSLETLINSVKDSKDKKEKQSSPPVKKNDIITSGKTTTIDHLKSDNKFGGSTSIKKFFNETPHSQSTSNLNKERKRSVDTRDKAIEKSFMMKSVHMNSSNSNWKADNNKFKDNLVNSNLTKTRIDQNAGKYKYYNAKENASKEQIISTYFNKNQDNFGIKNDKQATGNSSFKNPLIKSSELILNTSALSKIQSNLINYNLNMVIHQSKMNLKNNILTPIKQLGNYPIRKEDFDFTIPHPSTLNSYNSGIIPRSPVQDKPVQSKERGSSIKPIASPLLSNSVKIKSYKNPNRYLIYDSAYEKGKTSPKRENKYNLHPRTFERKIIK